MQLTATPACKHFSTVHDIWDAMYEQTFQLSENAPEWFNISTMLPAAAVTYAGLINTPVGAGIVAGATFSHDWS
ncbi:MAG TPA: hypothetical protein VFK96_02560 [Gammaproteobacteria bacterium]|nr:hypothetical protein [Gammaproteobacteria bacterium]